MIPYFFEPTDWVENSTVQLSEASFKHCITVLRMKVGESLILVNGQGKKAKAKLQNIEKKSASVLIESLETTQARKSKLFMAVGFTKNRTRNEWMLEKITEIGVDVIIPLQCTRSEREKMNVERLNQILISAMMQSQQVFLPELKQMMSPAEAVNFFKNQTQGSILIAHCEDEDKQSLDAQLSHTDTLILVGPEGDFSPKEIENCLALGAKPVSLGPNRLRTETATVYACSIFNQKNYAL